MHWCDVFGDVCSNEMEIAMTEKIVRSVTAHSVTTSELTKNAVNPRNSFIDNDKSVLTEPTIEIEESAFKDKTTVPFQKSAKLDIGQTPDYPTITEHFDTRSNFVEGKEHIHDNRQKLALEKPTDNDKFFESLHKIEARISTLRQKHPKENHQSAGPVSHVTDNMQSLDQVSYKDNILYREKKNIHANFQSVSESLQRVQAKLPANEPSTQVDEALAALDATGVLSDDIHLDDAQFFLNGELGAFDENELRAKVKQMQEKLTRVNQTLKDIENKKEST
jgi:hypothetical protein